MFLGACDGDNAADPRPLPPTDVLREKFTTDGSDWGRDWLNVRYEGPFSVRDGKGIVEVEPAVEKALQEGKEVAAYMARPVIVPRLDLAECVVLATVEPEGPVEAGVVCHVTYDEGYALLVRDADLLLYRYDVVDRKLLAQKPVPGDGPVRLTLGFSRGTVTGEALRGEDVDVSISAEDPDPLPRGFAGVLVNPASTSEGGRARFSNIHIEGPRIESTPRFAYRFAGAAEETRA
ncbi:MAG: hypothetical protein M3217_02220, partial [Actinomycetota bacterium]|nr:hypothetical protein [Actinomycetota bacterium]